MSNAYLKQFFYTPHVKPVLIDTNFIVAPGAANGTGVSNLVGQGIAVYLHSTATFTGNTHTTNVVDGIASTSNLAIGMGVNGSGTLNGATITAITSPTSLLLSQPTTSTVTGASLTYTAAGSANPEPGIAVIKLKSNWFKFFSSFSNVVSPLSGTSISVSGTAVLTLNAPYVITAVGTTTQAQWVAAGLNSGVMAAVGVSFIAAVTGGVTGTGTVQAPSLSGIQAIELIGNPSTYFSNDLPGQGSQVIAQFLGATSAGVTTLIPTAPATGSLISIVLYLSDSSVTVAGE
jgi:hypothetical protein